MNLLNQHELVKSHVWIGAIYPFILYLILRAFFNLYIETKKTEILHPCSYLILSHILFNTYC